MSGSFESVRWNVCVHRLDLSLYSHPKEVFLLLLFFCFVCFFVLFFFLGGGGGEDGVRTYINSKGKKSPLRKNLFRGGSNPRRCIKQDSEPNTLPTELPAPPPPTPPTLPLEESYESPLLYKSLGWDLNLASNTRDGRLNHPPIVGKSIL